MLKMSTDKSIWAINRRTNSAEIRTGKKLCWGGHGKTVGRSRYRDEMKIWIIKPYTFLKKRLLAVRLAASRRFSYYDYQRATWKRQSDRIAAKTSFTVICKNPVTPKMTVNLSF